MDEHVNKRGGESLAGIEILREIVPPHLPWRIIARPRPLSRTDVMLYNISSFADLTI